MRFIKTEKKLKKNISIELKEISNNRNVLDYLFL